MIEIMNTNGAIDHSAGSAISGGVFTIVSAPSSKVFADGSAVYRGPLRYTFSGGSAGGFVSGTLATIIPQIIRPTAEYIVIDNQAPIRLEDFGTMNVVGTLTSGGSGSLSGPVEIIDAGQNKVLAK